MLRRAACLALALILAVTSVGFAVARGQGAPAGTVEICTGAGTVMLALDAEGKPAGPVHLCPDAALFVADGLPPAGPRPPETRVRPVPPPSAAPQTGRPAPAATARGPPAAA